MLACIRCGACLNVCPVYRKSGGGAYGPVYSGPMGAVLAPLLVGIEHAPSLPHASSLCGACTDACPVKIPLHELLLDLRRDLVAEGVAPRSERLAFTLWSLAWSPAVGVPALDAPGPARPARSAGSLGPGRAWAVGRRLPRLAGRRYRDAAMTELVERFADNAERTPASTSTAAPRPSWRMRASRRRCTASPTRAASSLPPHRRSPARGRSCRSSTSRCCSEERILPGPAELFERVGGDLPSALAIVTGPSRSADIEQMLVVGVHGPGEVHVVLLS